MRKPPALILIQFVNTRNWIETGQLTLCVIVFSFVLVVVGRTNNATPPPPLFFFLYGEVQFLCVRLCTYGPSKKAACMRRRNESTPAPERASSSSYIQLTEPLVNSSFHSIKAIFFWKHSSIVSVQ